MKSLLKIITCGSVDVGKSTLIGHMSHDENLLFADLEKASELDSKIGSREGKNDYSLLLDGLMEKSKQGIINNVAYHYFTTDNRSFIVADCPGHEQYTKNMAVGASFADLAVILVDSTQGVVTQTKRHAWICKFMGIKHFILAVNKMDLIDYDKHRFNEIKQDFSSLTANYNLESMQIIPVSATDGDNVTKPSVHTPWYKGLPLISYLEERDVKINVKDENPELSDMFTAKILWMDDTELVEGRNYLIKTRSKILPAMVMSIKHKIDLNSGKHIAADRLFKNEMATCDIALSEKMLFDKFENNKALGGLALIDRVTNMISACGVIEHSLRRSTNVVWQDTDITREIRSKQKGQKPLTLWFTGLSGSGKSTLANEVEKRLVTLGKHTMLLDGDNVRHGLNKNLGFKEVDRVENIRRIAEVSKLMNDAGIITIASFISPYENDRKNARHIIGDEFFEIFVSTPLEECEKRDVKGLYKKARAGEIPEFTGISSPYEKPANPDIEVDTSKYSIEEATDILVNQILKFMD